ncbi:hypothetical protein HBA55_20655 [Pseudomaricurvus alkylphenolicus]|uniref:hypothetical protein n=1 Tax=Pseudomaricurvus alkylphenolicus TaxID=1306991 RepID=UPI001421DFC4|nr:hypothetical protein [Pseudomaricurvus alkylphenolicus]NIB42028.1 hypothetical protein [Pseudomaricurvus alkylphenolicus]
MARRIYISLLALIISSLFTTAQASPILWTVTDDAGVATTSADTIFGTFKYDPTDASGTAYSMIDLTVRMTDLISGAAPPVINLTDAEFDPAFSGPDTLATTGSVFIVDLAFFSPLTAGTTSPIEFALFGDTIAPSDDQIIAPTFFVSSSTIPTSSSLTLLALGIVALGWSRRRRK